MKIDPNFLLNAECVVIYNFFKDIIKSKLGVVEIQNLRINKIKGGDVLFIKPQDPQGEYHYFTACVNEKKTQVSVYQSWGRTVKLYKKEFPFSKFIEYLELLETVDFNKNTNTDDNSDFIKNFEKLFTIEKELYGITKVIEDNIKLYIQQDELNKVDEVDEDDEDEADEEELEENEKDQEVATYLNIPLSYYQNLKSVYLKIEKQPLDIIAYRIRMKGVKTRRYTKSKRKTRNIKLKRKN